MDDFQYVTNQISEAFGIVADGTGNVFVAGYGLDAANVQHWLVRKLAP